ncbi:hypothetical protein B1B04_16945 [Lysinibacillus sp. KCTC 33748]|uniref:DUF1648 domain-containing protein n=1 Tax=unclassified Lysinibacillus TaxID=2636778 RepID=UPI0009A735F8|nr:MULTISPECIES: DUF1648 domain-containing protein [unclassified Lysinibacillus]OXS72193.1 hypothetical protein B1B04_16945 [Lysinibacillus sp. KCTC 33748]SKB98334.1 Protein of unknown function [Lysinibacillus sp. AC-3]
MNKSKKSVCIIPWIFCGLFLVLSIIGVQNISDEIPITFKLNGPNWYGSKYFIFIYPVLSFFIGTTGTLGGVGKKKNTKLKGNLAFIIIGNLIVGGLEVYTILSYWNM